jgi:hypothetical protein
MINTKRARDRRKLRFETLDDAIRDAEALVEAERRGTLLATGNWAFGQTLGHLAYWASCPFDGYPDLPRPPWFVRLLIPLVRKSFLNKRMPAGVELRGVPGGTFGIDAMESEEGLAKMRFAFERLANQAPTRENPIFINMSHEDWIKLNLRHAELHLSFFHPVTSSEEIRMP